MEPTYPQCRVTVKLPEQVNCVIPAFIYTDRWDVAPEEARQRRRKIAPLGR